MRSGLIILAVVCLSIPGYGQRNTAALSGTTTDPTGAVIPAAQVTAIQTATGATTRTQSNESGCRTGPGEWHPASA